MIRSILALAAVATAVPAFAQVGQGGATRERYVQIREGERCPRGNDPSEVVVCGTVREDERFRIPEAFREPTPGDAQSAENRVAEAQAAGAIGTGTCSNVGPGGVFGCAGQDYGAWRAERRNQRAVRERSVDD